MLLKVCSVILRVPDIVMSDNGPQYACDAFKKFANIAIILALLGVPGSIGPKGAKGLKGPFSNEISISHWKTKLENSARWCF